MYRVVWRQRLIGANLRFTTWSDDINKAEYMAENIIKEGNFIVCIEHKERLGLR